MLGCGSQTRNAAARNTTILFAEASMLLIINCVLALEYTRRIAPVKLPLSFEGRDLKECGRLQHVHSLSTGKPNTHVHCESTTSVLWEFGLPGTLGLWCRPSAWCRSRLALW
jgi:hypothetical protein